jgi:phosphoserine phosphatase
MTTELSPGLVIQRFAAPLPLNRFKVIAFDMDSTLINIECIDEIADAAGKKAEVSAITEAAMRGEITDFKDSLRRRVALLKGVPASFLEQVYSERLRLNPRRCWRQCMRPVCAACSSRAASPSSRTACAIA